MISTRWSREHAAIGAAVAAGNAERAVALAESHLVSSRRAVTSGGRRTVIDATPRRL